MARFAFRKALRFGPVEVAVLVLGLALLAGGLWASFSEIRTTERLVSGGECVAARVLRVGSLSGLKLGRFAAVSYVVAGESYGGRLHYSGPRPRVGWDVRVCVDAADPATFVVEGAGLTGESTGLWLLGGLGGWGGALGLGSILVFAARHQWRFEPDEDGPRGSWREIRAIRPRHLRRR